MTKDVILGACVNVACSTLEDFLQANVFFMVLSFSAQTHNRPDVVKIITENYRSRPNLCLHLLLHVCESFSLIEFVHLWEPVFLLEQIKSGAVRLVWSC